MNDKLSDQALIRKQKAEELRELGINPYSNEFKPKDSISDIVNKYSEHSPEELEELNAFQEFLLRFYIIGF